MARTGFQIEMKQCLCLRPILSDRKRRQYPRQMIKDDIYI